MPEVLQNFVDRFSASDLRELAWSLGMLLGAILIGLLAAALAGRALRRWSRKTQTRIDDEVLAKVFPPLRWLAPLLAARATLPLTTVPEELRDDVGHAVLIAVIAGVGWLVGAIIRVVEDVARDRFDVSSDDNLQARSMQTQLRAFGNIGRFVTGVFTLSAVLMTFESVRQLGVSLLASAGVAGIVIGFAAQRSIATVVAGVQIALTQPIRVDDVVIVEGEWGRIEEITLTYVVVRIWDLRRLIVPISRFIEQPFQNWTRVSADLLGTVFLYVDYRTPVEALRTELTRILNESELWDRQVAGLVVTDATEHTLQVRALMSASDSSKLWDLRCHVREKLVDYLQREHPDCLPVLRAEAAVSEGRERSSRD